MAKKSVIQREEKRTKLVSKYRDKRKKLISIIRNNIITSNNTKSPSVEAMEAIYKLQALPRDSSRCRQRSRCFITGRPRGVYSDFGLCRNKLRELAMRGEIPGLKKASW